MAKRTVKGNFRPSPGAEREFYRQLKKVAQASGHLIETHTEGAKIVDARALQRELEAYSKKLGPWAERQAVKLLEQVSKSNKRAYANKAKAINTVLNFGVADQEVGRTAVQLLNEQVALIKSLPIEAGLRAQRISYERVLAGTRAVPDDAVVRQLEDEMGMSTEVAVNRAMLIARTETARANAKLNQARAQAVGSNQYRWHNSGDEAVRDSHRYYQGKKLQGRIFSWDAPPTLDDGMTGHPGTFPNCRCFAEPVFDAE